LLKETKRLVLLAIRFSAAKSLLDILEQSSTPVQEANFAAWVKRQEAAMKVGGSPTSDVLNTEPVAVSPSWKSEDVT
jgi:hypothetical protein